MEIKKAGTQASTKGPADWFTGDALGQTIFVVEGVGLCQREGGPIKTIRPGDSVDFEPGENRR